MTIPDLSNMAGGAKFPINPIGANSQSQLETLSGEGGGDDSTFAKTLQSFVQDVNGMQKDSANLSEKFVKGEAVDIHDVMIAAEKAKTSFQLLMELRNKGLDLYREAIRIQV